MSSTTVVQLRQQEADIVDRNGIYKCSLQNPVQIEKGDVVQVKSVFLDTTAEGAGVIEIEEDTDCDIECLLYITNFKKDQVFTDKNGVSKNLRVYSNDSGLRSIDEQGDNQKYFLAEVETGAGDGFRVTGFNVVPVNQTSQTKRFGGCDIQYSYQPLTPAGASRVTETVHIPSYRDFTWRVHNPYSINVVCKATAQDTADFRLESTQGYLADNNIEEIDFSPFTNPIPNPSANHYFTPQRFNFNFTLPRGTYTPSELTQTINDLVVNLQKDGFVNNAYGSTSATNPPTKTNWSSMSPFLTSVLQNYKDTEARGTAQVFVNAVTGQISGVDSSEIAGTHFITYNITDMLADYTAGGAGVYKPPVDRWIGSNQVALGYDEAENKMKWDAMHFPVYVNDSSSAGTVVNDAVAGMEWNNAYTFPSPPTQPYFVVNSGVALQYGGLAFTKLQPESLWQTKMGFGNICVNPKMNAKAKYPNELSATPTDFNSFTFDCVDGQNTTGALASLDVAVQHNNEFYSRPIFRDESATPVVDTQVSTSDTTSCFSSRVWNTSLADEGYFLIDVSPNFNQKLVGKLEETTTTQSIISRYFTANGFTNDMGTGSIVYEHVSDMPMMISDLQVRILNPDRTPVDEHVLNEKNTVFLEVVKSFNPS